MKSTIVAEAADGLPEFTKVDMKALVHPDGVVSRSLKITWCVFCSVTNTFPTIVGLILGSFLAAIILLWGKIHYGY